MLCEKINQLEKEKSETTLMLTAMKEKVRNQEDKIQTLSHVNDTSMQLQHKVSQLEERLTGKITLF